VATLTYLRAIRAVLHEVSVHLPAAGAAVNSFVGSVTAECPNVIANAPSGEDLNKLVQEMESAVGATLEHPNKRAWLKFARKVGYLRWSSRKLTRMVDRFGATSRAEAGLAPPDLCADLRDWVRSGYSMLPPDTATFLRETSGYAPMEDILVLLAPYARARTRTLLRDVRHLEATTLRSVLGVGLPALFRLQQGLGLQGNDG
jgi:hypothetical protein